MRFHYKFEKILALREREKDMQVLAYEDAIRHFEKVARKLYQLLKKKEDLEAERMRKMEYGLSVRELHLLERFLENLKNEIDDYQQRVILAREKMQFEQQKLIEKNIEVKKYEKIKEKEYSRFLEWVNQEDRKTMDELAMQVAARGK